MNIQLPDISGILPIAGLALVAVVCSVALILRSLLHSRVAMVIAVIVGVVAAGPALAFALAQIVGALVPLGVVAIIGVVVTMYLVQRNPELMSVVRDVVPRRPVMPPSPLPSPWKGEGGKTVVIDQPSAKGSHIGAPQPDRRVTVRRSAPRRGGDTWGGLR